MVQSTGGVSKAHGSALGTRHTNPKGKSKQNISLTDLKWMWEELEAELKAVQRGPDGNWHQWNDLLERARALLKQSRALKLKGVHALKDRFSRWMLETELEHLIKQAKQGKEAARAWHKECLHIYTSLLEEDAAKPGMLSPSDFQLRVVAAQHKLQACVVFLNHNDFAQLRQRLDAVM